MMDGFEHGRSEKFKLIEYVAADLRRAHFIAHGKHVKCSAYRLWSNILSPRFLPVALCRLAYFFYCLGLSPLAKVISFLNFWIFGIEIAIRCPIGKGLFFPHTQGTVIGAASIGENVTIFQGVTLGALEADFSYNSAMRPTVGDNVIIGSGAKVLGGVDLGNCSRVGANAVVLKSIPIGALAVGVPATVLKKL